MFSWRVTSCGCTNTDCCPLRAKADVAGCCSVTNPLREESEVEGWVNKAAELLTLKTVLLKAYFCTEPATDCTTEL